MRMCVRLRAYTRYIVLIQGGWPLGAMKVENCFDLGNDVTCRTSYVTSREESMKNESIEAFLVSRREWKLIKGRDIGNRVMSISFFFFSFRCTSCNWSVGKSCGTSLLSVQVSWLGIMMFSTSLRAKEFNPLLLRIRVGRAKRAGNREKPRKQPDACKPGAAEVCR